MIELLKQLYSPESFETSENNIWVDPSFSSFVFDSYFNTEIPGGVKGRISLKKLRHFLMKFFRRVNIKIS